MIHAVYRALWAGAAPLIRVWLKRRPGHKELLARFDPPAPRFGGGPLWIHACSVGEVNTARPVLHALKDRVPEIPVLLTTSTATGQALARKTCADFPVTWFPFDHPGSVRRFFDAVRPRALVLIETELWPNVIQAAKARNIPVVIVNGRISDKHFPRYKRFRFFFRPAVENLSAAGVQSERYADRMAALGLDPARIFVTGNTKFDVVTAAVDAEQQARLRRECGFADDAPILIFGSTRPGDEALAAECWKSLRETFPALCLVVAPRHLDRLSEALAPFEEPVLRRSEVKQGRAPAGERIFMVDTLGELIAFYSLAEVAVVGGSFFPGVNGHNPLEPAALGVTTVFGPYMSNFAEAAQVLLETGGAVQVPAPMELLPVLTNLLNDPGRRTAIGDNGRASVLANQGAIARNVELIVSLLKTEPQES